MIIVQLRHGLGNQIYQYIFANSLACKLNTELKLDLSIFPISSYQNSQSIVGYRLGSFNILENFATPEEVRRVKENGLSLTSLQDFQKLRPNLENFKGDIFIPAGSWMFEVAFFASNIDILRKEFTLKKPFSLNAESFKQKILSAECPVMLHFRHGDYLYNPTWAKNKDKHIWASIIPLDYYYTCIDILKQRYSNLTAFIFSDNLQWIKENLRLDIPTEFVEGCETDDEEWVLMSLCKYSIIPGSTFSRTAFQLNPNPEKKIFRVGGASNAEGIQKFLKELTPTKKESLLNSVTIWVPFDFNKQPEITLRPYFSLLLVVNNDAATISKTLNSILCQDYKYYEIIIIDNASTDGSDKICKQNIANKENVIFKQLWTKVKNAEAWNIALNIAQGYYVSFLKGNDLFMVNTLTSVYSTRGTFDILHFVDILHLSAWLTENDNGNVAFGDKKCSEQRDAQFFATKSREVKSDGQEAAKLLLNRQINRFLGTKYYKYTFLQKNGIKFDEHLADDEAELYFQMECFLKSKYFMYAPNAVYITPSNPIK